MEFKKVKVDLASVDEVDNDSLLTEDEEHVPHDLDSIAYKRSRRQIL